MDSDDSAFDIPLRSGTATVEIVFGIGLLAVAPLMGWTAVALEQWAQALYGLALGVFGGYSLLRGWRQVRAPRPGLRVDARGIHDNTGGSGGLIAWDQVDYFEYGRDEDGEVLYACRQRQRVPDHTLLPAAMFDDGVERHTIRHRNLAIDPIELMSLLRRHLELHRRRTGA